jgi:hypothetical protein
MKEWVLMGNIGKSYGVEPWPSTSVRLPDPEWPDLTPKQMLERCFGERVISGPDHPLVQALFGKA